MNLQSICGMKSNLYFELIEEAKAGLSENSSGTDTPPATNAVPTVPAEMIDLPAVKISKPSAGKKKVTVKWKKVSKKNLKKISGVQIQVATDPTGRHMSEMWMW